MRLGRVVGLSVLALAMTLGTARANDSETASKLLKEGQAAFKKKSYAKATSDFKASYEISRDPAVLHQIGESLDKDGKPAEAVDYYRKYVSEAPRAANRKEVESRIEALMKKHNLPAPPAEPANAPPAPQLKPKAEITEPQKEAPVAPVANVSGQPAQAEAVAVAPEAGKIEVPPVAAKPEEGKGVTVEPPPPGATAPTAKQGALDEDHPSKTKMVAWVGVGVTLAVLTTGAIFGLAAQERADEISRQQIGTMPNGQPVAYTAELEQRLKDLKSEGQTFNTVGIALMSASAATAVASAILFIVDARAPKADAPHVRLLPSLSPQGAGLAASLEF